MTDMKRSALMLSAVAWMASQTIVEAQAGPSVSATANKPAIRVLLETMHHEATLKGLRFNFSQLMLKTVLREEGALVEDSATVFGSPEKLSKEGLKPYDLIILNGRLSGDLSPKAFSPETLKLLEEHVFRGGFLLVIAGSADFGKGEALPLYNPLLSQFGMTFNDRPATVSGTQIRPSELEQDREHPLLRELEILYPCHGTTLKLTNHKAHALAFLGDEPCLAVVPHGFGWVVALGGGSGWMNQGMDPQRQPKANFARANQQFVRNLVLLVSVVRKGVRR
jgi:hypothetical protein